MPTRSALRPGFPSWVDLVTTDDHAARDVYAALFDWRWQAMPMPEGTYWMASLDAALIAGLSQQPQPGAPSVWNTYIGVDDADATVARATAAGAQVLMPPMAIGDSGRMAFLKDPAGADFGLWQAGTHQGTGIVGEPGAMIWNEVYAPDTAAIAAFYQAVFGWHTGAMPMPDGNSYTTFTMGDETIGGTAPPMPRFQPHWQVWFGSADVQRSAARAAELGGTIVVPASASPIGAFAFLKDPTGADFSIIAPSHG